jgi:hypothetical protein
VVTCVGGAGAGTADGGWEVVVFFFVDPAPAADCEDPLLDEPPFEPPELAEPPYDPAEFEYPELEEPEWETAGVRTGAGRAAACFWATDTFAAKALTVTAWAATDDRNELTLGSSTTTIFVVGGRAIIAVEALCNNGL